MSGCSGNQAVAVSIRELAHGLLMPREIMRVVIKEGQVGLCNGLLLGTIIGCFAAVWKDDVTLGLVLGGAFSINCLVRGMPGRLHPDGPETSWRRCCAGPRRPY